MSRTKDAMIDVMNGSAYHKGDPLKALPAGEYLKLFFKAKHTSLTKAFLEFFSHFERTNYAKLSREDIATVNQVVSEFLWIISQDKYVIPMEHLAVFMGLSPTINNVIAMSSFKGSEPQLDILSRASNNFPKALALYTARSEIGFDCSKFFDADPFIASYWYFNYYWTYGSLASKTVYDNMRKHMAATDDRLLLADQQVHHAYFGATYCDAEQEGKVKGRINDLIRNNMANVRINNAPDGKTIAIVTAKWFPSSSVYRCYAAAVRELAKTHPLELIHLGQGRDDLDTALFRRVRRMEMAPQSINLADICDNTFQMAFFPDIGMNCESICASNMRLAPIQVMAYGHPSSTYGSEIDYFIGGSDLEILEDAQKNYTERLVVIPGIGQPTTPPTHFTAKPGSVKPPEDLRILVNCPWSQDKTTYPLIAALAEIRDKVKAAGKTVVFRFFPNEGVLRSNYAIPYMQDISKTLGDACEINFAFRQEYIDRMATGDLALDSWPFNGYNTIIDSLMLGKPVVTLQGKRAFERVGGALLNRLGLHALVAQSKEQWIDCAVRLICDDAYRASISAQVATIDLPKQLTSDTTTLDFVRAIEALMRNGEEWRNRADREPIIIGPAESAGVTPS